MDYSEADEAPEFPEIEEEFVPQMDEDAGDDFGDLALDPLVLDDSEAAGVSGEPLAVSDDTEEDVQDIKQEKEKKEKTVALIDALKSTCQTYGMGNDGNEYKIITQVILFA